MVEEEPYSMELLKKPCYGNLCTSNDYCCPGTVCDWEDGSYGRCVFVRGRRLGEICRRDADCESGLICGLTEGSLVSVCSVPLSIPKQYNEECETSSDCDISRGLCCQLQRRHRQTHRKVIHVLALILHMRPPPPPLPLHNLDLNQSKWHCTNSPCSFLLQACAYFQSPLICIGNVAADQVRQPGHLSGAEKRLID